MNDLTKLVEITRDHAELTVNLTQAMAELSSDYINAVEDNNSALMKECKEVMTACIPVIKTFQERLGLLDQLLDETRFGFEEELKEK